VLVFRPEIRFNFGSFLKKGDLQVRIELPAGTGGTFVWKGTERELDEGISTFSIP
jgi:hypothetical protein